MSLPSSFEPKPEHPSLLPTLRGDGESHTEDYHGFESHRAPRDATSTWKPQSSPHTNKGEAIASASSACSPMSDTQPPIKPKFWRIHGIKTSERDAAWTWLQEQVTLEGLRLSEDQGFSLAQYDGETLCATLTAVERPTIPQRKPPWQVEEFFYGLTPVSDPEGAEVDIVAVTGLGGHALGSFRSNDNGAVVWLRDFAPVDVPKARFLTYGYDTKLADSDSTQGIAHLAQLLFHHLGAFRRNTCTSHRPLVFVCHSLGGLVLKEALVRSERLEQNTEVASATFGLIMLGVPNLGLNHRQLEDAVKDQPNSGFVRDLVVTSSGQPSQLSNSLKDNFAHFAKYRDPPLQIVSFFETLQSLTLVRLCVILDVVRSLIQNRY